MMNEIEQLKEEIRLLKEENKLLKSNKSQYKFLEDRLEKEAENAINSLEKQMGLD